MAEKPNVWASLIAMIALIAGFVLFMMKHRETGVMFTLIGVVIYLFTKVRFSEDS